MSRYEQAARWPAPWIFSLLILPFGVVVGFKFTPLTFLLSKAGVSVCVYFPLIGASHLNLLTALILVGGVADSLILASCGGLMVKTLSEPDQARGSAWWQVSVLGGGALGGAVVLWLAERLPLFRVGLCVALMVALPALIAFTIPEPLPAPSAWFQAVVRSPKRRCGARCFCCLQEPPAQRKACCLRWRRIMRSEGVASCGSTELPEGLCSQPVPHAERWFLLIGTDG